MSSEPEYVSAIELAEIVGYSPLWVRKLAQRGTIPAKRRGRVWLFDPEAVKKALLLSNSYKTKKEKVSDPTNESTNTNQSPKAATGAELL